MSELLQVAEDIERAAGELIKFPQVHMPVAHRFAPGVYYREIFMPAGTFVIGAIHKTCHFNIILSGKAIVKLCGSSPHTETIMAPHTFVSLAGVCKVLYILEDMRWATIHPTNEIRIDKLEDLLIENPEYHRRYISEVEKFRKEVACLLP
jgi:hypothetical protein